jgi:microcompartment protein CcmL/EutN
MIEVRGLSRGFRAASVAAHAAAVRVEGVGYMQDGIVMVSMSGDVASVEAAIGAATSDLPHGTIHATSILARADIQTRNVVDERSMLRRGMRTIGAPGGVASRRPARGRQDAVGRTTSRDEAGVPTETGSEPSTKRRSKKRSSKKPGDGDAR